MAAFTGCVFAVSACAPGGDGTLESCATTLVGTFEGDQSGDIHAQLKTVFMEGTTEVVRGELDVFFAPDQEDASSREAEMLVVALDTGELTPGGGALVLTGAIDFETCEGSGEWSIFNAEFGTWHIELRRPASF